MARNVAVLDYFIKEFYTDTTEPNGSKLSLDGAVCPEAAAGPQDAVAAARKPKPLSRKLSSSKENRWSANAPTLHSGATPRPGAEQRPSQESGLCAPGSRPEVGVLRLPRGAPPQGSRQHCVIASEQDSGQRCTTAGEQAPLSAGRGSGSRAQGSRMLVNGGEQGFEVHAVDADEPGSEVEVLRSRDGGQEQVSNQQFTADGLQSFEENQQETLLELLREVMRWKNVGLLTARQFEEIKNRVIFQRSSIPSGLRNLMSWRVSKLLDSEQFAAATLELLVKTSSWPSRCMLKREQANGQVRGAPEVADRQKRAKAPATRARALAAKMEAAPSCSFPEEVESLIAEVESALMPQHGPTERKKALLGKLRAYLTDLHARARPPPSAQTGGPRPVEMSDLVEEWERARGTMEKLQELCADREQSAPIRLRFASHKAFSKFQRVLQGMRDSVHVGASQKLAELTIKRKESQGAALKIMEQWRSSSQDIMRRLQVLLPTVEELGRHLASVLPQDVMLLAIDDCHTAQSMLDVAKKACKAMAAVDILALPNLLRYARAVNAAADPKTSLRADAAGPHTAGGTWAALALCLERETGAGGAWCLASAAHSALGACRLAEDLFAEVSMNVEDADHRLQALRPEPPEGLLQAMAEAQEALKGARRSLKAASRQWEDARDLLEDDVEGAQAAAEIAEVAVRAARRRLQTEEDSLVAVTAHLWQLQEVHFPELLVTLEARIASRVVQDALQALKAPDRAKVTAMLFTDRKLEYYGDLEELGGRHEVFRGTYCGCACVLKKLPLVTKTGLKSCVREVRNLAKFSLASNPYTVPLRGFFVEGKHGYLHFDEYPSDLEAWALDRAGLPMRELLQAAHGLVLAVQYIHDVNFVHGDLKPKNVLMDSNSRPLLCDFEFGREQCRSITSPAGVTSMVFGWSEGFAAPELFHFDSSDPRRPPTKCSDIFALGRTLQVLLETASPGGRSPELEALVGHMLQEEPEKRITATGAVADAAFAGLAAGTAAAGASEDARHDFSPPRYWSFQQLKQPFHIVVPTKYMKEQIEGALFATDHCGKLGSARVVSVRRVETQWLWRAYVAKRERIRAQIRQQGGSTEAPQLLGPECPAPPAVLDREVNEVFLWHGCPAEAVDPIVQEGFDERLAQRRCLYGTGTYFTPQACKALQYARAAGCSYRKQRCANLHCTCPGPKYLLYSRVCLGVPFFTRGPMRGIQRPPRRQAGGGTALFDSVVANPGVANGCATGTQEHQECVVWNHAGMQAYAEFIVELEYPAN